MLMAKKSEDKKLIRPYIDGGLADAIRYDAASRGMKSEVELVRIRLTDLYSQLGWLVMGANGELEFRRPPPQKPGHQ